MTSSLMSAEYATIEKWLSPWLRQLGALGGLSDYHVILSEMDDTGVRSLHLLNQHLELAAKQCSNFGNLVSEKDPLPQDLDEANRTVLNKLAEVRAIVGLQRLGFSHIEFIGSPDLKARLAADTCYVEVTRLGKSAGKRSKVWDAQAGSVESGLFIGTMHSGGAVEAAIGEAVYREIEDKYRQLKFCEAENRILWISLGRDYLTAGRYELPGIGVSGKMQRTVTAALRTAVQDILATGTYEQLSRVVLSPGRDEQDIVVSLRDD